MWWYWLALTFLLAPPLWLAARLAKKEPKLGVRALVLFLLCAGTLASVYSAVGGWMVDYSSESNWKVGYHPYEDEGATFMVLAGEFIVCYLLAVAGDRLYRREPNTVLAVAGLLAMAAVWVLVYPISATLKPLTALAMLFSSFDGWYGPEIYATDDFPRPFVSLLTFAACWIGAHAWSDFVERPRRKSAWTALVAVLGSLLLFQAFSQFGNWVHYRAHSAIWHRNAAPGSDLPYQMRWGNTDE